MRLKKCDICTRPFQDMGLPFCPYCMQELEDQYILVREYLYDNPNASLEAVAEATGVPAKVILYFIKDGRVREVNTSGLLRCDQCGKSIDSGRFCESCMAKIDERVIKPLQAAQQAMKQKPSNTPRMHTRD